MDSFLNDLRYAIRRILRTPGFTLAAAATLALGIGAATTIFTIVNAILLRPPVGVSSPDRLVSIYTSDYSGPPYGASSLPDYEDFRTLTDVFDGVASFVSRTVALGPQDATERAGLEVVSDNYFTVMGVSPAHGRFFGPDEGRAGAPPVAVIGDALFRRRFNGNASVVGTSIALNGRPFIIVGVAPPGFVGVVRPLSHDVWVPMHAGAELGGIGDDFTSRGSRSYPAIARLAPGISIEAAQARMNVVARQMRAAHPDEWTDVSNQSRRITLLAERDSRIPPRARTPALSFVALLMATVGIVLLVCCANVASLMLARSAARGREIGVRISLGATRWRLVRQLLTESALVALIGGAIGVLVAQWSMGAMMSLLPPLSVPLGLDLSVDGRVLAFAVVVSLTTGMLFGIAPALRVTRPDIVNVLKSEGARIDIGGRKLTLQNVLVVSQVAMSVILLVGAVLFVRALRHASQVEPGFRVENLLIARAEERPGTKPPENPGALMLEARRGIEALPGVRAVSWTGALPLGGGARTSIHVPGYTPREGDDMEFQVYNVGPGFFGTMEIPLARGRDLTIADRAGSAGVIIVNEAFAKRFWPGEEAIGKHIGVGGPRSPLLQVVGVSRNGRFVSLTEESPPSIFLPALQRAGGGSVLLVRTDGDPLKLVPAVRREIEGVAPTWTVQNAQTMREHIASSILPQRIAGTVLGLFAGVAVILVSVGLYGVVAYSVATRTREIGIRIALGARPQNARWFVVRQGATLVALGVIVALPVAWGLMHLLSGFLIGASVTDPIAFGTSVAVLGAVALAATYLPARRASLVDPMVVLRDG